MSIQDFALIDGKIAFIKDFLHLRGNYKDRPAATCPVKNCGCEMSLVLPTSNNVQPHFRHKSSSVKEHSPESLWHSGAKFHIAEQLQNGAKIKFDWKCKSQFCKESHQLPTILENSPNIINVDSKKIGKYLPDITLYYNNQPIAVIEIENTHESSDEKIAFYNTLNLPWFELAIKSPSDYEKVMNWTGGDGLQKFLKRHFYPTSLPAHCPTCKTKIELKEANEIKRLQRINEKQKQYELSQKARHERQLQAEEYKSGIGKRLLNYFIEKKSIHQPLVCHNCESRFHKVKLFTDDDLCSFEVNHFISHNSDSTCDIVILNSFLEISLFVLLQKKNSSNKDLKSELTKINTPYIEIEVQQKESTFTIVDSSFNLKNWEMPICDNCLTKQEESKRLRAEKAAYQRELAVKNEIKKLEAAIKHCNKKINDNYEIIRLSNCDVEKEQARQRIASLQKERARLEGDK